jgi:hypothetical protein
MAYNPVDEWFIPEFAETATVPVPWVDENVWEDDDAWSETAEVACIFADPYTRLPLGTAGLDDSNPVAAFRGVDVPGAREGTEITINGTAYLAGSPMPNGTGLTYIDLTRVAE